MESHLQSLEPKERAQVLDALEEIRQHGFDTGKVATRQIENKLWEIKISRHRVFYFVLSGPRMVLLHAYKKQGQKAPRAEIDVARSRMKEVING